jgi:16S rRNA (cytosine1402-N4)-methyltransferase
MSLSQLHKPVLLEEVLKGFKDHFAEDQSFYGVDGTFGRGGHTSELLSHFTKLSVLGLDQDDAAIDYAKDKYKSFIEDSRLKILKSNFSDENILNQEISQEIDFVFLDIGVSSPQLDNAERGFSFYNDGPLDMRMDQSSDDATAADVLNKYELEELRHIFLTYGEVYASDKVLSFIEEFRGESPFTTTLQFANLIEKCCGWRKKGMHPATLYFQALRIYVNKELESLEKALEYYINKLVDGGVFFVITFHSLEDRIVKRFFKGSSLGKPVNKKVIKPTREEELSNKRARSAKLRVFKKFEKEEKYG